MIHYLAVRMASVFVRYGECSNEDADIYAYACEAIIALVVNILACLAIAVLFNRFTDGAIFLVVFALLRRQTGGHHARTHLGCISSFAGIVIISMALMLLASWLGVADFVAIFAATVSWIGISVLPPIDHKSRHSGRDASIRNASWGKGRLFAFILWLLCITDVFVLGSQINFAISISMLAVLVSMVYAMYHSRDYFF